MLGTETLSPSPFSAAVESLQRQGIRFGEDVDKRTPRCEAYDSIAASPAALSSTDSGAEQRGVIWGLHDSFIDTATTGPFEVAK